jgi:hypothetical protein
MVGRRARQILRTRRDGDKPGTQPGDVLMAVDRVHLCRGSWRGQVEVMSTGAGVG